MIEFEWNSEHIAALPPVTLSGEGGGLPVNFLKSTFKVAVSSLHWLFLVLFYVLFIKWSKKRLSKKENPSMAFLSAQNGRLWLTICSFVSHTNISKMVFSSLKDVALLPLEINSCLILIIYIRIMNVTSNDCIARKE